MALLILALLQRIFLMSSLMLLLVWLIFFMVLIKLLPILGTISGKTVKLMVLALICLGVNPDGYFLDKLEPIPSALLGTISGKTVKLMVLALICLGNNRQD